MSDSGTFPSDSLGSPEPGEPAGEHGRAAPLSNFLDYLAGQSSHLLELALAHAVTVAIAVAAAAAIGVCLGILVHRRPRATGVALAVTGGFLTIPSYALFGLLVPVLGLGGAPTVVALTMYGLLPIVRNTIVGLRAVDPAVIESARASGMAQRERLLRIELPLAWPVILAGLRVATLILVGVAAIAAAVNGPGLGEDIFAGLARIGSATALDLVLGGILGIVALALLFDLVYAAVGRATISRGLRG